MFVSKVVLIYSMHSFKTVLEFLNGYLNLARDEYYASFFKFELIHGSRCWAVGFKFVFFGIFTWVLNYSKGQISKFKRFIHVLTIFGCFWGKVWNDLEWVKFGWFRNGWIIFEHPYPIILNKYELVKCGHRPASLPWKSVSTNAIWWSRAKFSATMRPTSIQYRASYQRHWSKWTGGRRKPKFLKSAQDSLNLKKTVSWKKFRF